ncbi:MAG: hypothetical protein JSS83_11160 [Cyanobacteria bacterium SZAS LIN-3]|nr:hypothetical protein [Cyanobacteria bacterium SZAS LIN-3]
MKTIVWLNNGKSKVLHGRFGGFERSRRYCDYDCSSRRPIVERIAEEEARLEMAASKDYLDEEGYPVGMHPHDLGLPNLSLVRRRLVEGDRRCGITEVLHKALGVAQWGNKRIEFAVRPEGKAKKARRISGRISLDLRVDESGRITAAHYG